MTDAIRSGCPEWCTDHHRVVLETSAADYHQGVAAHIESGPPPRPARLQVVGSEPASRQPLFEVSMRLRDAEADRPAFEQVCLDGPHFAVPVGIDPAVAEDLAAALVEAARTLRGDAGGITRRPAAVSVPRGGVTPHGRART